MRIGASNALKIAVQSNGFGVRRNEPYRCAEKDPNMRGGQIHDSWWNGISLHRLIDGREDDQLLGHVDDRAAPSKIRDDFVFMLFLGAYLDGGGARGAQQ